MVLFHAGRYDASIGYLHDILEFAPDNYLANLCLSGALCLAGRMDEARPFASRAQAVTGATNALARTWAMSKLSREHHRREQDRR